MDRGLERATPSSSTPPKLARPIGGLERQIAVIGYDERDLLVRRGPCARTVKLRVNVADLGPTMVKGAPNLLQITE